MIMPYAGEEVSGAMLWSPARHRPPHVTIPLPALGRCKVYVGVYGSGTWPIWLNVYSGRHAESKAWNRVHLRFSDEEAFALITPEHYPEEPRLGYISETLWRVADLKGQALVLSRDEREAMMDTTACLAYIRLVPTAQVEDWPAATKRLYTYFDSNFSGHFPDSPAEIRACFLPLHEGDYGTVLWTTCREDTCYYPTKIGNVIPADTPTGIYPYWAGRDVKRMLDRGEDPLRVACDIAHEYGLKLFGSYRRMTCRMPPFIFPLHREAMMVHRRDLWCADRAGHPLPHLSLAYPEVRRRMIDLLVEQATGYDIDGIHFFFSRGVPFVWYEKPVVEAFREEHGVDPCPLPEDDDRAMRIRARFFTQMLRELRAALDKAGKRLPIAMHMQNTLRNCLYYGIDVQTIVRERLLDILLPDQGHYLPPNMGEKYTNPQSIAEFVAAARGTGVQVVPASGHGYWSDGLSAGQRARAFYDAGVDGLHVGSDGGIKSAFAVNRRLGHLDELEQLEARAKAEARLVRIQSFAGMTFDIITGLGTCG